MIKQTVYILVLGLILYSCTDQDFIRSERRVEGDWLFSEIKFEFLINGEAVEDDDFADFVSSLQVIEGSFISFRKDNTFAIITKDGTESDGLWALEENGQILLIKLNDGDFIALEVQNASRKSMHLALMDRENLFGFQVEWIQHLYLEKR